MMSLRMKHPIMNDSLFTASPYWLGTWSMSGERYGNCKETDARATLEMAFSRGIRVFDTAPVYGRGQAELLLGKAFRKKRDSVFLSSKAGLTWDGRIYRHAGRPAEIKASFDASCKRLNTDYIDLLSLHWPDDRIDICDSVQTLVDLQERGAIKYWGVCNLTSTQLEDVEAVFGTVIHQTPLSPYSCSRSDVLASNRVSCGVSIFEHGLLLPAHISKKYGKKDHRSALGLLKDPAFLKWRDDFYSVLNSHNVPAATQILQYMSSLQDLDVVIVGPRSTLQFTSVLPTLEIEKSIRDEIVRKIEKFLQVNE